MNKNKYRLISAIIIFAVLYLLIFFGDKTNFGTVASGLVQDCVVNSSLPTYTFMCDVDKNAYFNLLNSILNDIYPMNEFMASNENPDQSSISVNGDELADLNDYTVNNNQQNANQDTTTAATDDVDVTEQPATDQDTADTSAVVNSTMDVISRSVMTGTTYARTELNEFNNVKSQFFTVTSLTSLMPEMLRPEEFLDMDLAISHDATTPQILIFHTHSQETFVDSEEGNLDTTIVGVGDYLTQILTEKYGYNVIHDRSVYDYVDGKLDRSKAYTYSEEGAQKILDENPSIELVIDLHRDGLTSHVSTNIDGKETAKIMFVNGLSYSNEVGNIGYLYNQYRDENLATSLQLKLLSEAYYPGFMKNIYCNAYRYCLHMRPKSLLIEAGANTNTIQEEKNAMEPLADLLDKFLRGEKAY